MKNRYISVIFISGVISWIAWIIVITRVVPKEHLAMGLLYFFVSLFIALTCSFAIGGFYFRYWIFLKEIRPNFLWVSFRQGILLSFIVILSLLLELMNLLNWITGILLIVMIMLFEMFFVMKERE